MTDKEILKNRTASGRFVKGKSGNPSGRPPKADCLISCIKAELESTAADGKSTKEQRIAAALVQKAERGDLKAIALVLEYTTVKPTAEVNMKLSGPLQIAIKWDGNRGTETPDVKDTTTTP